MVTDGQTARNVRFQTDFTAQEFAQRRQKVMKAMGGSGVAVIQGAPPVGGFDVFRQYNEFYYLCGVEVPQAYLMIDAGRQRSTLYMPPKNERQERSEGPVLCCDDAEQIRAWTGVEDVRATEAVAADLKGQRLLYLLHSPAEVARACRDTLTAAQKATDADRMDGRPSIEANFMGRVREICPEAEVRDITPILDGLRLIKSAAEVRLIRQASELSALAIAEAMRCTRPGVMEYQLGAVADYVFLVNGTRGGSYRAIIGGGGNAWMAHYFRNDCALRDGELVLMDYAPDVGNYTSDIGRMWPVNGRYSAVQRELYGLVVEYHKTVLSLIRPGPTPEALTQEAAQRMRPVIEGWRFSKPAYRQGAMALLDFKGHLSHSVGMAVHDACRYYGRPLEPGMVFAVDPQLWIADEKLYIRCEDTVAVTGDGCEVLTAAAPLDLDDVERVMREDGMLRAYPARSAEARARVLAHGTRLDGTR